MNLFNVGTMTKEDQFILDELTEQKVWWEKQIEDCEKKKEYYERELFKANRLIEIVQRGIKEDKK